MTSITKQVPRAAAPSRNPLVMLRNEMDDVLSRFWSGDYDGWMPGSFAPQADLVETPNTFEIRMDVPGLEAKDIDVQVHGNTVTLRGQRKLEKEVSDKTYHRTERREGAFARTFNLACKVDEQAVAAEYLNGVLTVTLPKCEDMKTVKVPVKG